MLMSHMMYRNRTLPIDLSKKLHLVCPICPSLFFDTLIFSRDIIGHQGKSIFLRVGSKNSIRNSPFRTRLRLVRKNGAFAIVTKITTILKLLTFLGLPSYSIL